MYLLQDFAEFFFYLHTLLMSAANDQRGLWGRADLSGALQLQLGDNCIQNFHLGRYIVGYTVANLVLH